MKSLILISLLSFLLFGCSPASQSTPVAPESTPEPTSEITPEATPEVTPEATAQVAGADDVFVVGDVGDSPDGIISYWQPFADYMAANLEGFSRGEVAVAPDLDTMIQMMQSGEVDIFLDSPLPAMTVSTGSSGPILLRQWIGGIGEYHTVIFVSASSGITDIAGLQGNVVAFDNPFSTSGYFLPAHYLLTNDYQIAEVDSFDSEVADDTIGYLFSDDDDNTINWVLGDRVVAGVTDNGTFAELPEDVRSSLVILAETLSLPRRLVVANPAMNESLQTQVSELLMAMDETEAAVPVLEGLGTDQFDVLPGGADALREQIAEILAVVEAQ